MVDMLQGGAQFTDFRQVQAQPGFLEEPPEFQAQVADAFFDKNVASQPGFTEEPPEFQEHVRQEFYQKYGIQSLRRFQSQAPQVDFQGGGNFFDNIQQDAMPFERGLDNIAKGVGDWAWNVPGQAWGGIQTELENNRKHPFQSSVDKYMALGPMAVEGARDFLQMPADLFAAAQNTYTGTNNYKPMYNLPSTRDLPYVGGWIGEQMEKYPVTNFIAGNAIPVEAGLGMAGKALKGKVAKTGINVAGNAANVAKRGRVVAPNAWFGEFGQPVATRSRGKVIPQGTQLVRDTRQFVQDAQSFRGIDETTTSQLKARAYKKAFDQLQRRLESTVNPAVRAKIEKSQSMLQKRFEAQKPVKAQKQTIQPNTGNFDSLANFVHELRKAGRGNEARESLKVYTSETRAKIFDEVHRREGSEKSLNAQLKAEAKKFDEAAQKRVKEQYQKLLDEEKAHAKRHAQLHAEAEKIQGLKEKQSVNDRIALEKAESKNRQRELKHLKAVIEGRAVEKKAAGTPKTEQAPVVEAKPREQKNFIGSVKKSGKPQNTVSLNEVVADSLSGNYGAGDALKAYDTLEALGYNIKQISKERNTLAHGKQYSITIAGKTVRFSDETLSAFLRRNKISADTIARGIKARGKGFNQERLLEMLPDSPIKTRFMDEQGLSEIAKRTAEEESMYEAVNTKANNALDKLSQSGTIEELEAAIAEIDANPDFNHLTPEFSQELGDLINEVSARIEKTAAQGTPETLARSSEQGQRSSEAPPRTEKTVTPELIQKNKTILEGAIEKKQPVYLEHRAERAGTREESTFRQKIDLPYEMGTNQKGEFVRTINENGQISLRYLEDIYDEIQVQPGKHPYTFDREGIYKKTGQPGRFRVLDEAGEEVAQTYGKLTKDSEVAKSISKMESVLDRIKKGEAVTTGEIMEAAKLSNESAFMKETEGLDSAKIAELCKKVTE